jgi:menaquinone-dependent protoporphyrinogen oxidase
MRVLVTVASRHGSTAEIAEEIGQVLTGALRDRDPLAEVEVLPVERVDSLDGYAAVVLGSAVYLGRWLPPARAFAEAHAAELRKVPVWLFSSGPVGDPLKPIEEPADGRTAARSIGAREHRVLPGRLDRHRLRLAERAVAGAVRVADGDFRDWPGIEEWACGIADALLREVPVGAGT